MPQPSPPPAVPIGVLRLLRANESVRPVPSASRYWATSHGRVITIRGKTHPLNPATQSRGYKQLDLIRDDGTGWRPLVHVAVMLSFGGPPDGPPDEVYEVHHVNGDKADNRLSNLRYVTRAEHRRIENQRGGRGNQTLTPLAVWEARRMALSCPSYRSGLRTAARALCDEFGVTYAIARDAVRGKTWRWVPHPDRPPPADRLAQVLGVTVQEANDLLAERPARRAAA